MLQRMQAFEKLKIENFQHFLGKISKSFAPWSCAEAITLCYWDKARTLFEVE